ncbi:hypothetical protein D043_0882A, partial [Vibrio parahaemolyticus EKP-021]|jgi:arginine decarboxylase
MEGT